MKRCTLRRYCALIGLLLVFSLSTAAHAADRYYMIVFAYDGNPPAARLAHTFATFVKVGDAKPGEKARAVESHTISWLPASLDIRLISPPERGANLDLVPTLKVAKAQNATVSAWGPFEIKKELFDRAIAQIKRLNSGAVAFKALDGRFRPGTAINCMHAVSDIVDGPMLDTGTAFGSTGSKMVLQHLSPWIVEPKKLRRDIVPLLGEDFAGISFRDETVAVAEKKEPQKR